MAITLPTSLTSIEDLYQAQTRINTTGSFKLRGATNAVAALSERAKSAGVIGYSADNHGRGPARAAPLAGVAATVVMPETAPSTKIRGTREEGANVIRRPPTETMTHAKHLAATLGLTLVPPDDDALIIAGQGTVGLEMLEQIDDLDIVLVPVGGGGLISGVAAANKSLQPRIRVIAVEPRLAGDLRRKHRPGEVRFANGPLRRRNARMP
jgi:threonine dehydratase